ncbi:hypothetical protein [Moraxella sp. CTOTU49803]|uniref:hypothetical protein n=1 Tax=Moraxella sp. CTOTU49803 TaxID=2953840 RepID=UPI0028B052AF|nr:hypothetical protein [Moraxella sp. CTOTU49803]
MMFFEMDEGEVSLADIKRIAKHLLDKKYVLSHITPEQYQALAYIITPTLAPDHNEAAIRECWQHLFDSFSIKDSKDNVLKFYQDKQTGRIYFGDEAGWKEAQIFEHNEKNFTQLKYCRGL